MTSKYNFLLTALLVLGIAIGCSTTGKTSLSSDVTKAKAEFLKADPTLSTNMAKASGYAIFASVGKGAMVIGAAAGTGQLFETGNNKPLGEVELSQVTVGFQLGGQAYSELILFEDQATLDNFKKGNFEFSAQASAVAATAGASANAKYANGVMVLTVAKGGLMYEASVGGQKFSYRPYPR